MWWVNTNSHCWKLQLITTRRFDILKDSIVTLVAVLCSILCLILYLYRVARAEYLWQWQTDAPQISCYALNLPTFAPGLQLASAELCVESATVLAVPCLPSLKKHAERKNAIFCVDHIKWTCIRWGFSFQLQQYQDLSSMDPFSFSTSLKLCVRNEKLYEIRRRTLRRVKKFPLQLVHVTFSMNSTRVKHLWLKVVVVRCIGGLVLFKNSAFGVLKMKIQKMPLHKNSWTKALQLLKGQYNQSSQVELNQLIFEIRSSSQRKTQNVTHLKMIPIGLVVSVSGTVEHHNVVISFRVSFHRWGEIISVHGLFRVNAAVGSVAVVLWLLAKGHRFTLMMKAMAVDLRTLAFVHIVTSRVWIKVGFIMLWKQRQALG